MLKLTWYNCPKIFIRCIFGILLFSAADAAEDVKIVGHIDYVIKSLNPQKKEDLPIGRTLSLLSIQLSETALRMINDRTVKAFTDSTIHLRKVDGGSVRVQLGMNHVPVLNQGSHGTCAMFANTAAIDAVLNKGDYISQLCALELGRYLKNNTYTSSGWHGSWGRIILNQMAVFGLVNKAHERVNGCAGLTEYPLEGPDPLEELSLSDYHQMSEPIPQHLINWTSILDPYRIVFNQPGMNKIVDDVKRALNEGDRMTFGILLIDFNQGTVGAVGTYHTHHDSWVLTSEIASHVYEQTKFAAHAMIITGYDDNAIAMDDQGRQYQGLFTLRNSWGSTMGDSGDFYMTYDYFKAFTLEVERLRHLGTA